MKKKFAMMVIVMMFTTGCITGAVEKYRAVKPRALPAIALVKEAGTAIKEAKPAIERVIDAGRAIREFFFGETVEEVDIPEKK